MPETPTPPPQTPPPQTPPDEARAPQNPLRGITLKILSVAVLVAMAALIKAAADTVPPGETVFFRSAFAVPVILVWLIATGKFRRGLSTRNHLGHFWRALVGTMAMGCGFAGLGMLPFPEVTAIGYASPLLVVVFAAMFLGEEVRAFRIMAVALGLVGVLIILSPRLTSLSEGHPEASEALGAILVLTGAVFAALAQVFVRKLVQGETTSAIVFYFSLNAAILRSARKLTQWQKPLNNETRSATRRAFQHQAGHPLT